MNRYKRYPKYKDSGVEWLGEVPEAWEVKRMRYVASFTNSNVDKKAYDDQESVLLCNYTDVYYNEFITRDLQFMQATASEVEIERFSLKRWDVLMTKDSEDPSDIGVPSLVTQDLSGVVCGYHLTMIRAHDSVSARLLHRSLMSRPTKAYFFIEAPGITRYSLGQDAIGNVPICLPPVEHRTVIADWIDLESARIDALIAKKTRFIELLQEKRSALITRAVTKGLDPEVKMKDSGAEWIGEVPAHWRASKLNYVASERGGKTPDTKNPDYWNGDIPWVSPKDMKSTVISDSIDHITSTALDECGMTIIPENAVLVVVRGMILAHSFPVAETATSVTINQDIKALMPHNGMLSSYLRLVLESAKSYVVTVLVAEAAHGTRVLRTDVWKQLPFMLPPQTEQKRIIEHVSWVSEKYTRLASQTQRSIELLKERRSALITAAVTGKIDVRGGVPNAIQPTHELKGAEI